MDKIIFFATLVLFPFGQLFKIGFVNLFDVSVLLLAVITIFKKPKYPEWYRYFIYFIIASLFSLLVNYKLFEIKSLLYLVRLFSYSYVAIYVFNNHKNHLTLNLQLLAISTASAVLGWTQYILWPDLTSLKYFGWDDHLLRMVGTFLDPTYLGLILVLGIIIGIQYKYKKLVYLLLFSLAFTYSRSSYFIVSLFLLFKKQNIALIFFTLVILFLPKNIGEGTNLARTVSANNKLTNYSETWQIFKKSPVYGIGFNNMCKARQLYLGDTNVESHACNGSDSSILFLLATTGIIGMILFVNYVLSIMYYANHNLYSTLLNSSFIVVLLHSLFSNSLFYPHIMFWIFALIGLKTKSDR